MPMNQGPGGNEPIEMMLEGRPPSVPVDLGPKRSRSDLSSYASAPTAKLARRNGRDFDQFKQSFLESASSHQQSRNVVPLTPSNSGGGNRRRQNGTTHAALKEDEDLFVESSMVDAIVDKLGIPEELDDDPRASAGVKRPKLQFRPSKKAVISQELLCLFGS